MPPRFREAYMPGFYPPPPPSPMRKKRATATGTANATTAGTISPRPRRKAEPPPPPLKPYELFAAQFEVHGDGTQDGRIKEYTVDVQAEWDALSTEDRQVWEAQYGRNVLESQNELNSSPNHAGNGINDDDSGSWSTDSEVVSRRIPLRERKFKRKPEKGRVKKSEDEKNKDSATESAVPEKLTAKIMYRTESYRVKKDMDGNIIGEYTKATKHDKPPKLVLTTLPMKDDAPEPVDDTLPIFEVMTYLTAPPAINFKEWMSKENTRMGGYPAYDPMVMDPYGLPTARAPVMTRARPRKPRFAVDSITPSDDDDFYDDDESEHDPDAPLEVEGEAGTLIEIHSPLIIDAIQKVGPGYPGLGMEGSSMTVTEPFCAFMHYRDQVRSFYEPLDNNQQDPSSKCVVKAPEGLPDISRKEGAEHVKELYDFVDHLYLKSVQAERDRWTQDTPSCTFEWAWLLFPPQTLVYEPKSFDNPVSRAFRVKGFRLQGLFDEARRSHAPSVNPHRLKSRQGPHFKNHLEKIIIVASYLKHDGRKWMSQTKDFRILPFKGEKKITELPVYPARFFNDPDAATRRRLIERGKRYHSLASRGQFEYHGETLSGARRRLDGRIMVDSETYHYDRGLTRNSRNRDVSPYSRRRPEIDVGDDRNTDSERSYYSASDSASESDEGPFNLIKDTTGRSRRRGPARRSRRGRPQIQARLDEAKEDDVEADELFMICHSELRAWVLKERDWIRLSVDSISPCRFDERMIDDLQITTGAKRLIQAFSQTFSMSIPTPSEERTPRPLSRAPTGVWSADFVPGKGRGQIMLLHGRPGVGKTTCAECIAELTKRPLLTITCGDLGTNSYLVEQELTRWLRLGALWNAVLLFDEADVFLESRDYGDIERNSLVSVFLRALEYYQGLMFLTTNRIGTFDEAILSRVHVILHFPDLTDTERAKIWDTSFRKLAEERPNIKIDFSLYDLAYRDPTIKALNWNGREIRNAFNTMIALAEFDAYEGGKLGRDGKVEVRREHLQEVAGMSERFKGYMKSLRGVDGEVYAKSKGLRDDRFERERKEKK